jgi:hypothetical protein
VRSAFVYLVTELDDVAILHDVLLALDARPTLGTSLGYRTGLDEVVEADDLRLDEALLEVGVDDARRLRRLGTLRNGPGARLLRPGGEVGLQSERVEADAGELVEPALLLAGRLEQLGGVGGVEVDELALELRVEELGAVTGALDVGRDGIIGLARDTPPRDRKYTVPRARR